MSRPLKVWGGRFWHAAKQCRAVIAATSQRAAVEALRKADRHFTLYELRTYWSETANTAERKAARDWPGRVIVEGRVL